MKTWAYQHRGHDPARGRAVRLAALAGVAYLDHFEAIGWPPLSARYQRLMAIQMAACEAGLPSDVASRLAGRAVSAEARDARRRAGA